MRSERYGITLKVSQGTEELMLFADDGINPFRIPLTLEDAIQLASELNNVIETEKRKRENNEKVF